MQPRLNIITLGVKDFEKSLAFYKDGLGWKPSSASQDDIAFFPLGGIVLALYPVEKLAEDASVPLGSIENVVLDNLSSDNVALSNDLDNKEFPGFTLAYNAKSEMEVDEVLKEAESVGARIVKKAQKVFWGGYSGYFADPDGYLWEVAYNPFFQFDERDCLKLPE